MSVRPHSATVVLILLSLTARNTTERVRIRASTCYGDPTLEIASDGAVSASYAVC